MFPSWGIPLQPALFWEDRHVIRTYSRIFQTYLITLLAGKFTLIVLIVRHAFIILPLGTRSLACLKCSQSSFFLSLFSFFLQDPHLSFMEVLEMQL